jgi:hypothetical protein
MRDWARKRGGSSGYAEAATSNAIRKRLSQEFALFHLPDVQVARDFVARFWHIGAKPA